MLYVLHMGGSCNKVHDDGPMALHNLNDYINYFLHWRMATNMTLKHSAKKLRTIFLRPQVGMARTPSGEFRNIVTVIKEHGTLVLLEKTGYAISYFRENIERGRTSTMYSLKINLNNFYLREKHRISSGKECILTAGEDDTENVAYSRIHIKRYNHPLCLNGEHRRVIAHELSAL